MKHNIDDEHNKLQQINMESYWANLNDDDVSSHYKIPHSL